MQRELGVFRLRESVQYISGCDLTSHTPSGTGGDIFFNNENSLQRDEDGEEPSGQHW